MRVALVLLTAAVLGLTPLAAAAPAAAASASATTAVAVAVAGERYVALGDSYAAGLGIDPLDSSADGSACGRSTSNYPHQLATALGLALTDVTCSGAVTADLAGSQQAGGGRTVAPQFDALTADTRLVTLTIGGNDLGFSKVAGYCASVSGPDGPVQGGDGAASCEPHYVTGGTDTLAADLTGTIRPALDAALTTIRERSPQAAVVVVDYPAIVPDAANTPSGGCWTSPLQNADSLPFTTADLPYLQQTQARLDQTLADAGTAAGAGVATVYATSLAHTACGTQPWVNGVRVQGFSLAPSSLHPNSAGAAAMTQSALPVARTLLAGGTASPPPTIASADPAAGSGVPGWVWGVVAVVVLFVALIAIGAFRVVRRRR